MHMRVDQAGQAGAIAEIQLRHVADAAGCAVDDRGDSPMFDNDDLVVPDFPGKAVDELAATNGETAAVGRVRRFCQGRAVHGAVNSNSRDARK
jgi:hypothetical protein